MEDLKKIIDLLDLIYYEYDDKKNIFIPNSDTSKDEIFNELIKITYNLSKYNKEFYIDKKNNIIVSTSNTLYFKLQRGINSLLQKLKNRQMNIYLLGDKKIPWAKNIPVFEIKTIKKDIDLSGYDALIFTSKNAVSVIDKIDKSWRKKDSYIIAPQTAKMVKRLKGKVAYLGKSHHGDEFAQELLEQLKPNQKVLYLRASKVVSSLVEILNQNNIKCDEKIVYETVCKKQKGKQKFPKDSTFIFSSPSTIECFFKNYTWKDTYKAISIGHTTQKYFPKEVNPILADTTSLDSCVRKAIQINS